MKAHEEYARKIILIRFPHIATNTAEFIFGDGGKEREAQALIDLFMEGYGYARSQSLAEIQGLHSALASASQINVNHFSFLDRLFTGIRSLF